ncbi:MAG TPA: ComEC/Rec2 family competence protein [Stellaceae bacterium]|nr:ComEC/Rec2 family competence protein [Stellaceae bacterium]
MWDGSVAPSSARWHAAPRAIGSWFAHNLIAERGRWALWLPVFIGTGIGAYFWLTFEPPVWIAPMGLAVGAAIGLVAMVRQRFAGALVPAMMVLMLSLGFGLAQLQTWLVAAPVLSHRLGPVTVEGRLVAVDALPEGTRLLIAPSQVERLSLGQTPARVRVKLRHDTPDLVPGQWLALRAVLMPPPGPAMPGAYDFQRRAWFDRLGAVGFALGAPRLIAAPDGSGPSRLWAVVEATREQVTARIHAALPGPTGAIAGALIAGETHAIPPRDAGAFRDAGLAHILVIAGLHMGMVAGIVFFGLRALLALIPFIALRYSTKKCAAAGALLVTFLYLLLSDATVSSRRAFVMCGLMLLGIMLDRVTLSARTLAYAAIAIMLLTPESATGPSFQMSFAAVAGLVASYEAIRPRLSQWHLQAGRGRRILLYLFGIALTTVVTTVATMPFTIYHFNRFPLYSVLANIVAVPITGFWIMPWAVVSCVLMPVHLETLALTPMGWGIDAVAAIAHGVTALPGAVLRVPSMPPEGLVLLAFGGLWLCVWQRRWRLLGLAPMVAGYATLLFVTPPDILISNDAKLVAVRSASGDYMPSHARGGAWTEDNWTQRAAATLAAAWPKQGDSADGRLHCDGTRCFYRLDGQTVGVVRKRGDVAAACGRADLVISPVAAHYNCHGATLIDSVDTWKRGGHAVWLSAAGIAIESVADWRGQRPWTHDPLPRRLRDAAQ